MLRTTAAAAACAPGCNGARYIHELSASTEHGARAVSVCCVCHARSLAIGLNLNLRGGCRCAAGRLREHPLQDQEEPHRLQARHAARECMAGCARRTYSAPRGFACSLPCLLPQSILGSLHTSKGCDMQLLSAADHAQPHVHRGTAHCTLPVHSTRPRCTRRRLVSSSQTNGRTPLGTKANCVKARFAIGSGMYTDAKPALHHHHHPRPQILADVDEAVGKEAVARGVAVASGNLLTR